MLNSFFQNKKKFIFPALLLILATALFLFMMYRKPQIQRKDYDRIDSLKFDTAFLSMYPIDTYHEEDFTYYRAMTVFKASYCMPDFSVVEAYMKKIASSGNPVTTVYLGILPDKTYPKRIQALANRYPGITFEIILSYPSADYWRRLSEKEYSQILQAYCDFLAAIPLDTVNVNFYFLGSQEWLINNPANYEDELRATEDIAKTIMLHSDRDHQYLVTEAKIPVLSSSLGELTRKIRDDPRFPDLSDLCIVFFGDSVIANYDDSTSIPGTVAGRTNATVYNCGYGGNSAAMTSDTLIALPGITEAFFQKDLSVLPEEAQVYRGISAYLSDSPTASNLCFVINYGLNDYFAGYPVSSEDPYDITTYSGAIRTAIRTIRTNAPDARIILCTPNFTAAFENGTEPHGDDGNVITDYVNAVLNLSEELETYVLDNYHELGITAKNHGEYLADGVHPNAACRYLIGTNIIRLLR